MMLETSDENYNNVITIILALDLQLWLPRLLTWMEHDRHVRYFLWIDGVPNDLEDMVIRYPYQHMDGKAPIWNLIFDGVDDGCP